MIRALFLLIRLALAGAGIFWLLRNPGSAHIEWMGYEVETTFAILVLCVAFAFATGALIWKLLRFICMLPFRMRKNWQRRGMEKGIQSLYRVFTALEQNDLSACEKLAQQVGKWLREPALALYIEGICARKNKRNSIAHEKFRSLLQYPEALHLGLIAGLKQTLNERQDLMAWELYNQIPAELKLSTSMLLKILDIALSLEKFDAAMDIAEQIRKDKTLTSEEIRAIRGRVSLRRSQHLKKHHNDDAAWVTAQEAWDMMPCPEAAFNLVPFLILRDKKRKASLILRSLWKETPDERIATLASNIPDAPSSLATFSLLQDWSEGLPPHSTRSMLMAKFALQAGLWGEAQAWVDRIPENTPTLNAMKLRILGDIELGKNPHSTRALSLYQSSINSLIPLSDNGEKRESFTATPARSGI